MDNIQKYLAENYPHISYEKSWIISGKLMYKLGECSAIVKSLLYLPLEPSARAKLMRISLIKGAQATTAIEGNTLSEDEVNAIAEGGKLPESRKYLEIEVKNVIDALNAISGEVVHGGRVAYVSCDLIRSFHQKIGQDLGEHFEAVPGRFRENNVVVGNYRAPEYRHVNELMKRLCDWLQKEFSFAHDKEQDFTEAIIEAIVAHVYIAWIHPFGDGNGRTARLIEFYLLLRGGLPNICSHILSNHYNQTRSEYYRQLERAGKERQLTDFIEYAVQGFLDGLTEVLWDIQQHQLTNAWKNYVYEVFDNEVNKVNAPKKKRLRSVALSMDLLTYYSLKELKNSTIDVAATYKTLSERTINRDVEELITLGLMYQTEENTYCANIDKLVEKLPKRRRIQRGG